jgi:GT2 family glycosyltransferase
VIEPPGHRPDPSSSGHRPDTGRRCDVVIATRNRPDAIKRCLQGLARQTTDNFGVIVVDDCSEPPLRSSLDEAVHADLDLELVELAAPSGPAAARNAGVEMSAADFIVFVDDDVVPNDTFLAAHLGNMNDPDDPGAPIVSCGPFVQPPDWEPTPWNLWEARQMKKEADALQSGEMPVTWRQFHTGNNCMPRRVFVEIGGFDETYKRAEDDELALRLDRHGCAFRFEPNALAWHYSNRTLDAWLAIPRAYAYYDVEIDRANPEVRYLATKKAELARRRLPLRIARALLDGPRRSQLGVTASVLAARAFFRLRAVGASMAALSVAYDLTYMRSLDESERAAC